MYDNREGPFLFSSIMRLQGLYCYRKDDLESLGYCIMWLIGKDKIPWNDCQYNKAETLKRKR